MCTYVKKVELLSSKFGWKSYANSKGGICHVHMQTYLKICQLFKVMFF